VKAGADEGVLQETKKITMASLARPPPPAPGVVIRETPPRASKTKLPPVHGKGKAPANSSKQKTSTRSSKGKEPASSSKQPPQEEAQEEAEEEPQQSIPVADLQIMATVIKDLTAQVQHLVAEAAELKKMIQDNENRSEQRYLHLHNHQCNSLHIDACEVPEKPPKLSKNPEADYDPME